MPGLAGPGQGPGDFEGLVLGMEVVWMGQSPELAGWIWMCGLGAVASGPFFLRSVYSSASPILDERIN